MKNNENGFEVGYAGKKSLSVASLVRKLARPCLSRADYFLRSLFSTSARLHLQRARVKRITTNLGARETRAKGRGVSTQKETRC